MPFARLVLTALLGPSVLLASAFCAMAAVLAQLGRWLPAWDALGHGAVFYLAAGILALLSAALFHGPYRMLVGVAGAVAIFGAAALAGPEYLRWTGPKAAAGAARTFTIVQFNAWGGQQGLPGIVAWLNAQNADVLVIEESSRRLRIALMQAGWQVTHGRSDVMLFTRDEPLRRLVPTDNETGPMHLNGVVLRTAAGEATVLGVHYPWPNNPDLALETRALLHVVRPVISPTTVIAGDFNSTPWSFALQRQDRDFGLIRRDRALASWPAKLAGPWGWLAPFPILPIDHLYAGSAWSTVSIRRGPRLGSDHYPVVVTLAPVAPR